MASSLPSLPTNTEERTDSPIACFHLTATESEGGGVNFCKAEVFSSLEPSNMFYLSDVCFLSSLEATYKEAKEHETDNINQ
jgi:hypothetical protein